LIRQAFLFFYSFSLFFLSTFFFSVSKKVPSSLQCTEALVQFLEFLTSNLEPKVFDALIPNVDELCSAYGLEPSVAFLISRAKLTFKIKEAEQQGTPSKWNEGLAKIAETIQPILSPEIWKGIRS